MRTVCKVDGCNAPIEKPSSRSLYCDYHRKQALRASDRRYKRQKRQKKPASRPYSPEHPDSEAVTPPTSNDYLDKFKPYIAESIRTGKSYGQLNAPPVTIRRDTDG